MTGKLIVFEGLDRSGKTTQCKLLQSHIKHSIYMKFPYRESYSGKLLHSYLTEKSVQMDPLTLHYWFIINRRESLPVIQEKLNQGYTVILDRYVYSGIVYSSAGNTTLSMDEYINLEPDYIKPDKIFYMDIHPDVITNRPGFGEERFESYNYQSKVYECYKKLIECTDSLNWNIIDATQPIECIHSNIIERIYF
jgi:dTMP kinase